MQEAGKMILVVDDDPDARTFLTTVLQDNGYRTCEAADGEEALAVMKEHPPDLIALDITMPVKSGVAVYRALKQSEDLMQIPVIIVTGISDDFRRFISTRSQVPPPEGYISKPIDHEQLVSMVEGLLGQPA